MMKSPFPLFLLLGLILPVLADNPPSPEAQTGTQVQGTPPPKPATGKPKLQATNAVKPGGTTTASVGQSAAPSAQSPGPAGKPTAPTPATTPVSPSLTLDAYVQALGDSLPLTKDEQTSVKTYYLEDGSKLKDILNNGSISPEQQMDQVDDLRNARNTKIEALLSDVDRQQAFLKMESGYRVALTELAADGGLTPNSPPPHVPQPTATAPGQTEKAPNAQSAP